MPRASRLQSARSKPMTLETSLPRNAVMAIALAFAWAPPHPAAACRLIVPTDLETYDDVALVRVTGTRRGASKPFNKWQVTATLEKVVAGEPMGGNFEFSATVGRNGCLNPRPKRGALWVMYFGRTSSGAMEAFPIGYARDFDARVSAAL